MKRNWRAKMKFGVSLIVLLISACLSAVQGQQKVQSGSVPVKNKTLIVFFDGLRPDYITREQMPNLFSFKQKACYGAQHHSVFPTVTRVNSSSYATGSYPGTHGLLGNSVYFPEVSKSKAVGTSYADLTRISKVLSGPLLTAVTLGEVLQAAGERMMVFSSGTTGQAFLQNYKISGGAVVNPDLILPESFKDQVIREIGPVASDGEKDNNRHKWITDALLKYGLDDQGPLVSAIWFSDPDGAAHSHGIGSTEAVEAIKYVDGQFGRILAALKKKGLDDKINIIISTDHGFVTHVGKLSLTDFLIREGFKKDRDSEDVVIAEGAVYVQGHDKNKIKAIVAALHKEEWIGAVFTKGEKKGASKGWVEGTLSFEAIHYDHPRSGDILVAMNWDDRKNDKGYAGTDFSGGVAGHGGSSPYEIHIALFAHGPDFKRATIGNLPTSNVDIAPTVLSLYNLPVPGQMDGRVISEFLLTKPARISGKSRKEIVGTEAKYAWGTYKLTLQMSVLDGYRYFDFSKVERSASK